MLASDIKILQSELVKPEVLELLMEEWYKTHLYEPETLADLLEVVE